MLRHPLSALLSALLPCLAAVAQDAPRVEVPTFQNPTCPIMGKKVSMPLFVDTALGRFYVCCKPCYKKILANVEAAHKTGYPTVEALQNERCPVSGEPIGEHAVEVTLQGYRFKVCCSGCEPAARQHHQVTLAKVTAPTRTDVGNATCPISGEPVAANAFAVVGGAIVHLADPKLVEQVEKDPQQVLAKAREIAAAQPPRPKHEHVEKKAEPKSAEAAR